MSGYKNVMWEEELIQMQEEEIKQLKKKLDEAIEVLEIISNSKYEANPWTLVPSKESLIAKEFLKGLK
jgi:hypothetical protein